MVCGRMGLLDEAIRDHLELKRRAGADPAEIAHAERAALAPVFPDEPRAAGDNDDVTEQVPRRAPAADDGGAVAAAAPGVSDEPIADAGEETVEIDMEAVLAADDGRDGAAPVAATPVAAVPADSGADGFEWEDPTALAHDADVEGPPEQIPGQERMSLE